MREFKVTRDTPFIVLVAFLAIGCLSSFACSKNGVEATPASETESSAIAGLAGGSDSMDREYITAMGNSSLLIQPSDIVYLGAFRLPEKVEGAPDSHSWEYGGHALTYCPTGDPSGPADEFTGSLFGAGFQPKSFISEITIPVPIKSPNKNPNDLNTAKTLQGFSDVGSNYFGNLSEIPQVGLSYLFTPDTGEKIHLAWGQHFHEESGISIVPSHAWFDLSLSSPSTRGAWWIGDQSLYSVNGYLFEIPRAWADEHVGGRYLAAGRFRDGGWSGKGPSLFAYGPWLSGNPPKNRERLGEVPLLLYSHTRADPFDTTDFALSGYQHPDEWEGGAWLETVDGRSAVIFIGTKGTGDYYWYGWANPAGPDQPCVEEGITDMVLCYTADGKPCNPEITRGCSGHTYARGWWSSRFDAQIIFYDPSVFAAVAGGELAPHQPQPYAVLDIDEYLFLPDPHVESELTGRGVQRRYRLGETAHDREHGLIYVTEYFADGAKPIIHVFVVK
jgi:hypothetical protein